MFKWHYLLLAKHLFLLNPTTLPLHCATLACCSPSPALTCKCSSPSLSASFTYRLNVPYPSTAPPIPALSHTALTCLRLTLLKSLCT